MSMGAPLPLVPGELRGYRRFLLLDDGLYPVVHHAAGPWQDGVQGATCSLGGEHEPPDPDCTCGLYGWYDPRAAAGSYGGAAAVIRVSGRVVLGDRGFRAARGRIEAVALPAPVRWQPRGAARARRVLAARYPGVRVYRSGRRMVREHPPDDVSTLGIGPLDRTPLRCRQAALALWVLFVLAAYGVLLLPRPAVAAAAHAWWPVLVLGVVAWQVVLVALVVRSQPDERIGGLRGSGPTAGGATPGGLTSADPTPGRPGTGDPTSDAGNGGQPLPPGTVSDRDPGGDRPEPPTAQ